MKKVKAIVNFHDLQLNKAVAIDEEYEVADARAKELAGCNNAAKQPLVKILEPATTPTTKKGGRGKKKND